MQEMTKQQNTIYCMSNTQVNNPHQQNRPLYYAIPINTYTSSNDQATKYNVLPEQYASQQSSSVKQTTLFRSTNQHTHISKHHPIPQHMCTNYQLPTYSLHIANIIPSNNNSITINTTRVTNVPVQ